MRYVIKGHASDEIGPNYNWDESFAGSETIYYDTEAHAKSAILELRTCGPDFANADWRVFAVDEEQS
jgi:hypothetical protein